MRSILEQSEIQIRTALKNDAGIIHRFIEKLEEYEKLSHEVVSTAEDIRETLFGDRPYAEVLLAYLDGEPAGFALFFHNYSTFLGKPNIYLEDLFIDPSHRGKGYGKKMLQCLAKIAVERGCSRLDWQCLDWNKPSIDFYEKLSATAMRWWLPFRLQGSALDEVAKAFEK